MKAGYAKRPPPVVEQWNHDMTDFLPEILYNFDIKGRSDEVR
jgi:hypothetical protein